MPPKRIPSSFSSVIIKDGNYIDASAATKISATKLPTSASKVGKSDARSKAAASSTSQQGKHKALKVRSDDPTVLMNPQEALELVAKMKQDKCKKGKLGGTSPYSTTLTRVDSAAPTALIAPADYEHIYKAGSKTKEKGAKGKGNSDALVTVASEAPTALIAPADYEHIFKAEPTPPKKGPKGKGKERSKSKRAGDKRIPSDAPTCLVMAVAKQDQEKKKPPKKGAGGESKDKNSTAKEHTGGDPPFEAKNQSQPPPESGGCCCLLM